MHHKERIIAAIEHKKLDRIPTDYWGTAEVNKKIMEEFGINDITDFFRMFDIDKIISVQPEYKGPKLRDGIKIMDIHDLYNGIIDDDYVYDYWGVKYRKIIYGKGSGFYYEIADHPLSKCTSIDEIKKEYIWPEAGWFNYSTIQDRCKKYSNFATESGYFAIFYMYSNIRGLEKSLMDLACDEKIAFYIIEKISEFYLEYGQKIFEQSKGLVDITQVTDDFGSQKGLIMSREMFNKYFKDPMRKIIKLAKSYNIKVFHHDDGSIIKLIPDLIEIGIDVLNPIQWHLEGMDLNNLKDNFGSRICFHGGIDNQKILPFGSLDDVRNEVKICIDKLANDNTGYILAPCHSIQVNTPVENIVEMYKSSQIYGKFE